MKINHQKAVDAAGKRLIARLVDGAVEGGNWRYDLHIGTVVGGTRKLIEVKTALISVTNRDGLFFGYSPCRRWHWAHLHGSGKTAKGADRLILIGSHRLVYGQGPFIQSPDFYDLDYEYVMRLLKHPNESITLSPRGWNKWSRILPAFKMSAEDLTATYGRNATRRSVDQPVAAQPVSR
jgi:hypothetical protein